MRLIPLSMSCDKTVKRCLLWNIVRDPEPMGFTGGWSCRHLLPSMYKNSRLPEEKQLFNINRIVCTKFRYSRHLF